MERARLGAMAFLTHSMIVAAYGLIAACAGLIARQMGAETPWALVTGGAAFLLFVQIHAAVTRLIDRAGLDGELTDLRRANIILSEEAEELKAKIVRLNDAMDVAAAERQEERASELAMIEGLLARVLNVVSEATPRLAEDADDPDETLAEYDDSHILGLVKDAVQNNRIDLYLQPIVSLPQRKVRYLEAYSRLRGDDGGVLTPTEYLPVANAANLTPLIDSMQLFRSVQALRRFARLEKRIGVFCNISLNTLRDAAFFPQFLDYLAQNRDLRSMLIFEFSQATLGACGDYEKKSLSALSDLGFAFSLDQVTALDFDLAELQELNFRFVKISGDTLMQALQPQTEAGQGGFAFAAAPDIHAEDFKELLNRFGMDLIAEKLETEAEVVEILDFQVDYGQGYVFGAPRLAQDQDDPAPEAFSGGATAAGGA